MAVAKAKGRLRGKKPKLSPAQERHLVNLHHQGAHTTSEIAELFGVAAPRSTKPSNELKDPRQPRLSDGRVVRSPVEITIVCESLRSREIS